MKKIGFVAHAVTAGGGVSVGKNFIRDYVTSCENCQYLLVIPQGFGFEDLVQANEHRRFYIYESKRGKFGRLLFDEWVLPQLIKDFAPDIVIGLGNKGVLGFHGVQVILVHNAYLFYPWPFRGDLFSVARLERAYLMWHLRMTLRNDTSVLLVQTQTAAHRMRTTYAYNGELAFLPNVVSKNTLQGDQQLVLPQALKEYGSKLRLFCLTRYYPHKNLETLVELFRTDTGSLNDVVVFITIRSDHHPMADRLLKDIARHGLQNRIVNVGPVDQVDLASFYRNVHGLILPTLLESFSGTYIEAMQFGVPILTSNLDFAREVCGDLAFYFDPRSMDSIRQAILRLRDSGVPVDYGGSCRARLDGFHSNWGESIRLLASSLDGMLEKKGRRN